MEILGVCLALVLEVLYVAAIGYTMYYIFRNDKEYTETATVLKVYADHLVVRIGDEEKCVTILNYRNFFVGETVKVRMKGYKVLYVER